MLGIVVMLRIQHIAKAYSWAQVTSTMIDFVIVYVTTVQEHVLYERKESNLLNGGLVTAILNDTSVTNLTNGSGVGEIRRNQNRKHFALL